MVPKSSSIRSYRDLARQDGRGDCRHDHETALSTLAQKQRIGMSIVSAADHAQSLDALASGKADAFATDAVLLYGFIATQGMILPADIPRSGSALPLFPALDAKSWFRHLATSTKRLASKVRSVFTLLSSANSPLPTALKE